jgi:signal transduction histidine kinase
VKDVSFDISYLNQLPHGYCLFDNFLKIVFWNQVLAEWSQLRPEEVIGKRLPDLFPDLSDQRYLEKFRTVVDLGVPTIFSSQIHHHLIPCPIDNGEFQTHKTYLSRIKLNGGRYLGSMMIENETSVSGVIRKYRQTCDELQNSVKKADIANKHKTIFLASMSHDLRTPLHGIMSVIGLLNESDLSFEQKGLAESLEQNSNILMGLLNDILDISKIAVVGIVF